MTTRAEIDKEFVTLIERLRNSVENCKSDTPELSTEIMVRSSKALIHSVIDRSKFDENYFIVDNFNRRYKNICLCRTIKL